MTKEKLLVKLSAYRVVLILALIATLVGFAFMVKAYSSYSGPKVVVEGDYLEAPSVSAPSEELGALTGPDISSKWISVNGDTEYHVVVPFDTASSTFVSFANPFGTSATSTVVSARLQITSAASSTAASSANNDLYINCGAKATQVAGVSTVDIINVDALTPGAVGTIENNLTAALGGAKDAGTVAKITLNPTYPYFQCFASSTNYWSVDNAGDFAGKATVVIRSTR